MLAAGLLVTASAARAEDPLLGATVDGLLNQARRLSPDLAARALDAAAAEADANMAGPLPDPSLRITSDEIDVRSGSRQNKMIYAVEQEFPLWGKRGLKSAAAMAKADIARAEGRAVEAALAEQVEVTFAQYWVANRSIAVLEDLHTVLDGVVASARTRYSQGRGAQAEVLRAEAALTKHQTEIARFVAQKNTARGVLNALILRDPGARLAAPAQLRPLPEAAVLRPAELIARAQDANPALAAENGRISAANSTLQLAHKGWYPDVTLSAGAIDRGGNGPNGYVASIGIRVPLQWGLHEAEERKATADRDATRARREATGQDVARSIAEATAMLAGARESERLIRTQLLPQDDAVVRSSVVSYGYGRIDLASVLDAARELAEANLSLLATQLDEQRQLAAIERLIGGPL